MSRIKPRTAPPADPEIVVTYTVDRVVDPVGAALLKEALLRILRPKE